MNKLLLITAVSVGLMLVDFSAYAQNNRDHRGGGGTSPQGGVAVGNAGSNPWYGGGRGGGGQRGTPTTGVKPAPAHKEKEYFGMYKDGTTYGGFNNNVRDHRGCATSRYC
jgi:hypothetical protein